MSSDPVFGLAYGPPKVGKTLAFIRAFPTAVFFSLPGAMSCSSWLDVNVKHIELPDVDTMIKAQEKINKQKNPPIAVIYDDASLQFDADYLRVKKKTPSFKGNDQFNQKILDLRDVCRASPCHVWWNMHEQAPRAPKSDGAETGKIIPGTIQVAGWQLPEKLPAMMDFVAHVVYDEDAGGWPYVYRTRPDGVYIQGDRLNISPGYFPLNIGELLRSRGDTIPRAKGLEWLDDVVAKLADLIEKTSEDDLNQTIRSAATRILTKHNNQKHVRWAIADAYDRVNLRRYQANLLDTYLDRIL